MPKETSKRTPVPLAVARARQPRKRSPASARAAGTRHETNIADYLARHYDDRVERRTRHGNLDRGDIGGIRLSPALGGGRVVAELKNVRGFDLTGWYREACTERDNDGAVIGLVIHKRWGTNFGGDQWVTLTVDDLITLLTGARPTTRSAAEELAQ